MDQFLQDFKNIYIAIYSDVYVFVFRLFIRINYYIKLQINHKLLFI